MAKAYQKALAQTAPPSAGVAGSGLQQAADSSVVGVDANVVPTRNYQRVGGAVAVGAFTLWDGSIP
jgi:hypothetical protein